MEEQDDQDEEGLRSLSPDNPEDQVVGGGPGRTFEQLLAQQLGHVDNVSKEEERQNEGPKEPKPFLRRGQGLTRFNLPPDPKLQPSMLRRSKSKPNLRDTKSKLDQETKSFASKKTAPEDRYYIPSSKPSPSPTIRSLQPPTKLLKPSPQASRPSTKPALQPSPSLKLKSPTKPQHPKPQFSKEKPRQGPQPRPSALPSPLCNDSVENSFREKLGVQEKKAQKDLKELAVFEMLEDAANDSSFCSTSSRVKTLLKGSVLPSPHRAPTSPGKPRFTSSTPAPRPQGSVNFSPATYHTTPSVFTNAPSTNKGTHFNNGSPSSYATPPGVIHSTPLEVGGQPPPARREAAQESHSEQTNSLDPSLGETLMEDIRLFLRTKQGEGAQPALPVQPVQPLQSDGEEDSEEWTDEEEEEESTTLREEEQSIGQDWRERIQAQQDNQDRKSEDKENRGELLEFSPPEKMPKNSPSYLIWSIFTKWVNFILTLSSVLYPDQSQGARGETKTRLTSQRTSHCSW